MDIHNRFVVAKGHRVAHKSENYKAGRKFPAAHLGIPPESVESLIRDGAIFDPAELREPDKPEPVIDDGLGDYAKSELSDIAERYGIDVKTRMSKDDLIAAIRNRTDGPEETTEETTEEPPKE